MTRKEFFEKMRTIKTAEELYEFICVENANDNLINTFYDTLDSLNLMLVLDDDFLTDEVEYLTKRKDFDSIRDLLASYKGNVTVLVDDSQDYDKMLHYNISDYIDDIADAMEAK